MKKCKLLVIFLMSALSLMMPKKVEAQIIEVGATAGMSYYIGDINPAKQFSQSKLAFGGALRYYQNLRWAFRLQYSYMNLESADAIVGFMPERDKSFASKVNDFSFIAEFNFFDYWTGSDRDYITPYIFAGVSVLKFNSEIPNVESPEPAIVNKMSMSVPFGAGLKYSVSKRVGLTLEWRMHKSFTDEIDGIIDNNIGNDKEPFAYKCDWYSMLGLSVSYKFNLPKKDACYSGIKAVRY